MVLALPTTCYIVDDNCPSHRVNKKNICEIDREKVVQKCSRTFPTISGVIDGGGSWPKLWGSALHLGSRHTIGLRNLSRLMGHHGRDLHPFPLCDIIDPPICWKPKCVFTVTHVGLL